MASPDDQKMAPVANGNGGANAESDDEDLGKLRPVDIEQDVREMERRKRVEAIMSSKLFREELERVVSESLKDSGAEGISNLLSDVLHVKQPSQARGAGVLPINDIRGLEGMSYTKSEKALRCKLAAVYRLVDMYGWSQGIYNHVTVRISQDTEHFLLNPFGVLYSEVTASSLVKVNMQGEVVEAGTTNFGVNIAGFMLHSAIHSARPDIKCVIHVHTPNIVAVSSMKCGLLALCQEACLVGDVSYHNYEGIVVEKAERETLARDLGVHNKVMLLRNHGAVCCGETIEEAFFYTHHLALACDTQQKLIPHGVDNLVVIDEDTRRKVFAVAQKGGGGVNSKIEGGPDGSGEKKKRCWSVGELEFEALMRMLDNAGFRTGHVYKQPLMKEEPAKPKSDVELPPAVSSLGYLLEEENLYKDGPLRALLGSLTRATKGAGRTKWVNSPNVYQKVEVLETGTPDPKKITKWVQDGSPSHSTPVKVDSPNQFVPLGTNKKEFKKLQQAMKEGRRAGGITAGPESKVLEGVTWDEARGLQDGNHTYTYDQVDFKVGAASKGIIQRDYQHHATVYKTAYAKNPFDNISSEELAEYKRIIDAKSRGEDPDMELIAGGVVLESSTLENAPGDNLGSPPPPDASVLSPASPTTDTEHTTAHETMGSDTKETLLARRQVSAAGLYVNAVRAHQQAFAKGLATLPAVPTDGGAADHTYNGEDQTDGNQTFSEGEGDTSKATDTDISAMSPKREKKKRSGLRTPSFLKKKKKDREKKKEKA